MNLKTRSAASISGKDDEQFSPNAFKEMQEKMTALLQLVGEEF